MRISCETGMRSDAFMPSAMLYATVHEVRLRVFPFRHLSPKISRPSAALHRE